jgi:hypothetical protein
MTANNAEKKVRTGTFLCWIFGHKFVIIDDNEQEMRRYWKPTNFCIRCGIDKHPKRTSDEQR